MTISAKIILDSICAGDRITTMELKYPRFIHSEFMTHRVFSRNASSSRAIPVARQIEMIREDTAMPIHWGKNQPGMQANEEHSALISIPTETGGCVDADPKTAWLTARDMAVAMAEAFATAGYHKQIVNRLLEPFSHITVLVTSDQWANFFALRDHEDAQPEIRELAKKMLTAMEESEPKLLHDREWHLPYINNDDGEAVYKNLKEGRITRDEPRRDSVNEMLCAISAARCARVSYLTHDKTVPTLDEDMALFRRLSCANPPHMSPCEHQAVHNKRNDEGNFKNWSQFRHLIRENTVYD